MTRFVILALLILALALPALSEQDTELDALPMPVGGMTALMKEVVYPKSALKDGLEGKVLISVVISADGKTKSAEVMTSVREDLDQAALNAVRNIKWTPAMKGHEAVEATVVVPIQFKLDPNKKR
ncbi:MAG: energy transducer TonB [Calditrichaeota bacterium]|nr:energy transducer TonB [Calditrichota bacterium]MCB9367183.1 energy transducer TonB [Calditrichota bacterium]